MRELHHILLKQNSREEFLPEFSSDFPYAALKVHLNQYNALWHWHNAVQFFYVEEGTLEYRTQNHRIIFPQGSGGFINTGVLHISKPLPNTTAVEFLHILSPSFLSGYAGSLIEKKYIVPITSSSIEILPFSSDYPIGQEIVNNLKDSFLLSNQDFGYEIKLRELLSEIWLKMHGLPHSGQIKENTNDDKIKQILIYIHDHFDEKLQISDLASAAYVSDRECYRLFHRFLHTTPRDYLQDYRLQRAKQLLAESSENITDIALSCGFGSSSAFARSFHEQNQCTPMEYRKNCQSFNK